MKQRSIDEMISSALTEFEAGLEALRNALDDLARIVGEVNMDQPAQARRIAGRRDELVEQANRIRLGFGHCGLALNRIERNLNRGPYSMELQ